MRRLPREKISRGMKEINLGRIDLNLLVTFEALMDERSVVGAADRLGKTASAVSHALARLREQLGDPLMVKVGGRMQPSPFALRLIEDVRPILRNLRRVITPPPPFDPNASDRVFRIAMPAVTPLMAAVFERVDATAPGVGLEWLPATEKAAAGVLDGEIDIAYLGSDIVLPDGIKHIEMAPIVRMVFAREGHPALDRWDMAAWLKWPHVMVSMVNSTRHTTEAALREAGLARRIGARIPDFAGVAPLLARTNMLATTSPVLIAHDMDTYGLRALAPPMALPDLACRLFWSARLANDPGSRWIRQIVVDAYVEVNRAANARIARSGVIPLRGPS